MFAQGLSEAETQQLEDEVEDAAKKLASDIDLFGETDSENGAQRLSSVTSGRCS